MRYRHTSPLDPARKHLGSPGPWAQLPWRILGMLFIAALLIAGQQHHPSVAPARTDDVSPAPAPVR